MGGEIVGGGLDLVPEPDRHDPEAQFKQGMFAKIDTNQDPEIGHIRADAKSRTERRERIVQSVCPSCPEASR